MTAITPEQQTALIDLFWTKVEKSDDCWTWKGKPSSAGYGRIYVPGGGSSALYAHRVSYELHKGPISDGLHIDHLCRNRICVNPAHLEAVTPAVNQHRTQPHRSKTLKTKSTCRRGHSYDDAVLVHRSDGRVTRQCRTCLEARVGPLNRGHHLGRRDTCKNGHAFTPENTRIIRDGNATVRRCRTCVREWAYAAWLKRAAS